MDEKIRQPQPRGDGPQGHKAREISFVTQDRHSLAAIARHPIQYQAGLWRAIAAHPRVDLNVIYLDRMGIDATVDPTMGARLEWDLPLLEGYPSEFVRNLSPFRFTPIFDRVNPGLVSRLRARSYDVVMIHGYLSLSNWMAIPTAKSNGSKIIYRGEGSVRGRTLHDGRFVNYFKSPLNAFFLRQCDAIACSSEDNQQYQLNRGAPADRLFSMPCAVDNEALEALRQRAVGRDEFRRSQNLPLDARLVICVGRFFENKCTSDCIDAFATEGVRAQKDVHLVLVGDGPLRGELEKQARDLGVHERIHFLGFLNQSKVIAALGASDLFVLASNRDPSPKALSEALYLGLPVVCSDGVGTSGELVHPAENGFVFACRDTVGFGAILERALSDTEQLKRMGIRSHEIALENDFNVGVESLVQKLDVLLERNTDGKFKRA